MSKILYTEDHEWVQINDDGSVTVGITEHAQDTLGDVVFVELPEVGRHYAQKDAAGVVESVKAAADVYMPLDGTVTAVNDTLTAEPSTVNSSPLGEGWFFRVQPSDASQLDGLMTAEAYAALIEG
ncbi:glycine cleavage system protein GcvH [Amphibiibacter pelophylacis]|uniref:Glycine cleavage system protein GcvH n=1 Tax=Amphibiibacter pelophylacis TaxID=1799477 RepID=A0ACC6P090_9BURK